MDDYDGYDSNRCVVCGDPVPEGRQVCRVCEILAEMDMLMVHGQTARPTPDPVPDYKRRKRRRWFLGRIKQAISQ